MTAVAIYTRLSHDRTGRQTATHRQQAACQAFAELRGWRVARVFEDVDLSAYRRGVVRPAYEEMLLAIQSKRVDGVVAWKLDRLVRRSAEFERLWETCEKNGVFLASAMEPIDTSTDLGLALVRVLVAFASLESATSGVRLRAKFKERAEQGIPHTTAAAYGIRKGWRELEPEQADRIREAARRVLTGESVRSIVLDWNERGVESFTGRRWSHTALRGLLLQPRLASLLHHNGEIVGKGDWPLIIDEATHHRLKAILLDPNRVTVKGGGHPHLLSGVLRCGVCGTHLYPTLQIRDQKHYFVCPSPPKGCSRVSIRVHLATRAVCEALFERIHNKRYGADTEARWQGLHEAAVDGVFNELHPALKALATDYYVRRTMTRDEFLNARNAWHAAVEQNLTGSDQRPAALRNVHNLPTLRRRWDALELDEQRAILRSEIAHVTVRPAVQRGRVFDERRVEIAWVDDIVGHGHASGCMTTREAADRLGISPRTLRRWVADGKYRPEKLGNTWLFRRNDLDRLVRERDSGRQ